MTDKQATTHFQKLASDVAKLEGKKSPVSIGNVREVLSILTKLEAKHIADKLPMEDRPLRVLKILANKQLEQVRAEKRKAGKK